MEKPIELNDAETAAVAGGLLNNIFVNLAPISNSFATNSNNTASIVGNTVPGGLQLLPEQQQPLIFSWPSGECRRGAFLSHLLRSA